MGEANEVPSELVSMAEVAMRLQRSRRTVYRWRREWGLPSYHIGGSLLFDWRMVVAWVRRGGVPKLGPKPGARRRAEAGGAKPEVAIVT